MGLGLQIFITQPREGNYTSIRTECISCKHFWSPFNTELKLGDWPIGGRDPECSEGWICNSGRGEEVEAIGWMGSKSWKAVKEPGPCHICGEANTYVCQGPAGAVLRYLSAFAPSICFSLIMWAKSRLKNQSIFRTEPGLRPRDHQMKWGKGLAALRQCVCSKD